MDLLVGHFRGSKLVGVENRQYVAFYHLVTQALQHGLDSPCAERNNGGSSQCVYIGLATQNHGLGAAVDGRGHRAVEEAFLNLDRYSDHPQLIAAFVALDHGHVVLALRFGQLIDGQFRVVVAFVSAMVVPFVLVRLFIMGTTATPFSFFVAFMLSVLFVAFMLSVLFVGNVLTMVAALVPLSICWLLWGVLGWLSSFLRRSARIFLVAGLAAGQGQGKRCQEAQRQMGYLLSIHGSLHW
jgi:hypothetical protein